ncbi:cytochrome P450 [Periconia macrospinosa]|uniref:Cytochrome P450 n=1 Tax=Periconia macrospinosa TaxID=97972 RepID=A0A2V1DA27_9PLEO|nr:cytochrome P450 [Periconia macrospinosa]
MTVYFCLALVVTFSVLLYFVGTAVYNLFLHPLAKIPGPWLPALTPWYEVYFDCIVKGGGQYPFHIKKLHEKYGPIIRPTPNEVHISDPSYLDTIYAIRNRNAAVAKGLNVDSSLAGAEDFHLHRVRREAMNPYFSPQAILKLQHLFTEKKDECAAVLNAASCSGIALNISDLFFAYSNDIVRSFSFGSDSALLKDLQEAKRQRKNLARLLTGIHLQRHFTAFFRFMGQVVPLVLGAPILPPAVVDLIRFKEQTGKDIETILADKENTGKIGHSVFYELRDSAILPPEEKTATRLQDEATLLVMAGTESTAKSLGIATFYILHQPEILSKLREELRVARLQAGPELPLARLLALPYLSAAMQEANRLSFGVTNRLNRYSPKEALAYTAPSGPAKGTEYVLPPKTHMATLILCTHTDESLFPNPWRFDPERWIASDTNSTEEVNWRKRCMTALGKGHRRCIGVNVANAAMSLVLAELTKFDLKLFETDESDVKFQFDFQVSHARMDSKGIQVLVEGLHQQ